MLKPPGVVVVGYALLLAALIAGSRVQRVGDAGEYMAMALNLSAFQPPSLSPADIARAKLRAMSEASAVVRAEVLGTSRPQATALSPQSSKGVQP